MHRTIICHILCNGCTNFNFYNFFISLLYGMSIQHSRDKYLNPFLKLMNSNSYHNELLTPLNTLIRNILVHFQFQCFAFDCVFSQM